MSTKLFLKRLADAAGKVECALDKALPDCGGDPAHKLNEAMRYSLLAGGKRLRAYLVTEFCLLCGGDEKKALPYACGVEMLHAFSLIHDDLPCMDNDVLRRGKPTNHVVYGESTAMLAGDGLSVKAFEMLAGNPFCDGAQNAEACLLLAKESGVTGMCGGQIMDLEGEHHVLDAGTLETLVLRKTGALFAAACELGCIAAGADREKRNAAREFAFKSGLAFQIADDLLDLYATAEELGKTPGKDLQSEKNTFPALLGEKEARSKALSLCEEAKGALKAFAECEAKEALKGYLDFVMSRKN